MHITPRKRLGQNFLVDRSIQDKIIASCVLDKNDVILEIGPGRGELTDKIRSLVKRVYAVELDSRLYAHLKETFSVIGNVKLIHCDILKFDLNRGLKDEKAKVKVIANIPYYISSPIIEHLLCHRKKISVIYLTLQKELARRIVAVPGNKDYGAFSCYVQYYAKPRINFFIKAGSFFPRPKVDSAFLELLVRDHPAVAVSDEEFFFKVIRSAFGQRRKTLKNSLSVLLPRDKIGQALSSIGIDPGARAEDLGLSDYCAIARNFSKKS